MKSSRLIKESYKQCTGGKERKSQKIQQPQPQPQPQPQQQPSQYHQPHTQPQPSQYHQAQNYQSTSILKGFVLFSLALMISLTILYIVRHCIVDMVIRYGLTSKHEMLLYLLTLVILFGSFALYYTE